MPALTPAGKHWIAGHIDTEDAQFWGGNLVIGRPCVHAIVASAADGLADAGRYACRGEAERVGMHAMAKLL